MGISEGNDISESEIPSRYELDLNEKLEELRTLLLCKHHDYGSDNLKRHGCFGINVRLSDKLARVDNLLKLAEKNGKVEEPVEDTYLDIAGYAIQALLLLENKL
jgi:hypothetical protein